MSDDEIGKDYVIKGGKLVWLARYPRLDDSRWVSAAEQNAEILTGDVVISWEMWTGADQIIEGQGGVLS